MKYGLVHVCTWPTGEAADCKERGMFPLNDELYMALIRERQAEIQRAFERYHLTRAAPAAQPPGQPRLVAVLQRVRPWVRALGAPHAARDTGTQETNLV
jgi:hypothetical protein